MTLYLKYRPQTIDELDLESVRESLKNIISSGNLPHAFLFSGPKGTGKTSSARILAKIINCQNLKSNEPCNICDSCISITKGNNMDIIELDAASNRGIDDIRNLKEGIYLAPANSKYKVYIIDEAHMLTLEAANAFLKTLEEPPSHAIFILATTNPEKLPQTVISRLTQINFTKATLKDINRQLIRVAAAEKIKIEEEAINLIAQYADGSFRDAVKILESLSYKTKDIKKTDVDALYFSNNLNFPEFFEIIFTKDPQKNLEFIENAVKNGNLIKNLIESSLEMLHKSLLAKNNLGEDLLPDFSIQDVIELSEILADAKNKTSVISQLPLEIAILKWCKVKDEGKAPVQKSPPLKIGGDRGGKELDENQWKKLLEDVRSKNVKLEALLRTGKALGLDGKNLIIGVCYQFHKERLEDIVNISILEKIVEESLGIDSIKISFELIEREVKQKPKEETVNIAQLTTNNDKDIIDAAKEIFG